MNVSPSTFADRSAYQAKYGNPAEWVGDFRARPGRYHGPRQPEVSALLERHRALIVGLTVRGRSSKEIAAVVGVSREAVLRRLRPLGLKNAPGQVGRPPKSRQAA